MIMEPSQEADEAHDILMKQRGYDPIAKAIDTAAKDFMADVGAKAAMFDDLVEAIDGMYHSLKYGNAWNSVDIYDLLVRARELQK